MTAIFTTLFGTVFGTIFILIFAAAITIGFLWLKQKTRINLTVIFLAMYVVSEIVIGVLNSVLPATVNIENLALNTGLVLYLIGTISFGSFIGLSFPMIYNLNTEEAAERSLKRYWKKLDKEQGQQ